MRHFRSILYAWVLAPAVWVLVGVGLTRDLTARGRDGFAVESATGLVLLLLGGAAYGILLFAPISPAGPTLAGVAFLGAGIWAIEAPVAYAAAWPPNVTKVGFDLSRPGYGLAVLLSVPLLLTALSARRWARYEPPVLPVIGQIGRARGSVAAPGTPIAVIETAVLPDTSVRRVPQAPPVADEADTTVVVAPPKPPTVVRDEEPTVVVVVKRSTAEPRGTDEGSTGSAPPHDDEPTEPVVAPAVPPTTDAAADEEATRPLRLPTGDLGPTTPTGDTPGERTQIIAPRGAAIDDDRTQVIRSPGRPFDGERTQVIRPGLPVPTGERTEAIRVPSDAVDPPRSDAVDPPISIAGAEAPAFGDDPTSRIVPPAARSDDQARTMTVMSVERPPDDIPAQRKPSPAED